MVLLKYDHFIVCDKNILQHVTYYIVSNLHGDVLNFSIFIVKYFFNDPCFKYIYFYLSKIHIHYFLLSYKFVCALMVICPAKIYSVFFLN